MSDFDVIVVGAGTAGSVFAARLAENRDRTVLLVDAGRYFPTRDAYPSELLQASSMAGSLPGNPNNWEFSGEIMPGRTYPFPRGKVFGGSSSLNGCYFIRGRRQDFDEWAGFGNDEWSYDKVLPYFVRSETDLDFAGPSHGSSGPMPVAREPFEQMRPISQLFIQACLDAGFPNEPDKNTDAIAGVGPIPHNVLDGQRINTALAYLSDVVNQPNFSFMERTYVRRVLFEGTRATGVEVERDGVVSTLNASEVVLSAGTIKTPHLLMLSGIGPADVLRSHGIEVRHESLGVGRNVMDNPSALVHFELRDSKTPKVPGFIPIQACLNFTASESAIEEDLQINCTAGSMSMMMSKSSTDSRKGAPTYLAHPFATLRGLSKLPANFLWDQAKNRHSFHLMCGLEREVGTGEVALLSSDPNVRPVLKLNYLYEPEDVRRMRENIRTAEQLLQSSTFRKVTRITSPGDDVMRTDRELDAWIMKNVSTSFHTAGSAKMGQSYDPSAVVDQYGRVHGVEGLRVADLSICPTNVRRGPAATAVLIGERIAGFYD
jgi:choline dehydrogenase